FSYDASSELVAKHGQLKVLNDLLLRKSRIESAYSEVDAQALGRIATNRIESSLAHYERMHLNFLSFEAQKPDAPNEEPEPYQEEFDHLLERAGQMFPSNQLGGEMRMLEFDTGADSHEIDHQTFSISSNGQTIFSHFSEWTGVTRGGWTILILLWLMVGAWFFLLMKKIFQPDRQRPLPLEEVNWKSVDDIAGNF